MSDKYNWDESEVVIGGKPKEEEKPVAEPQPAESKEPPASKDQRESSK